MEDIVWKMAVEAFPQLATREDVKSSPENFVPLIKILSEVQRAEQKGDFSLSKYKNIDEALDLIEELKPGAKTFSETLRTNREAGKRLLNVKGYYEAQTLIENDFLPTDERSMKMLLNTTAPLKDIMEVRDNLTTELMGNIYSFIDCELRDVRDFEKINQLIEENPKNVLALMAVSVKNKENNIPQVRATNVADLTLKLQDEQIQSIAEHIPLTDYETALKSAYEQAQTIPGMNKARVVNYPNRNHSNFACPTPYQDERRG